MEHKTICFLHSRVSNPPHAVSDLFGVGNSFKMNESFSADDDIFSMNIPLIGISAYILLVHLAMDGDAVYFSSAIEFMAFCKDGLKFQHTMALLVLHFSLATSFNFSQIVCNL